MRTSKSTLTVARMAMEAAREAVDKYAHPKCPRKFTKPQLLACLIVKELRGLGLVESPLQMGGHRLAYVYSWHNLSNYAL